MPQASNCPPQEDQRLPPATGAWQETDPVGDRRFAELGSLDLELGGRIPAVRVAYELLGTVNDSADNVVVVLHALTGDAHVAGQPGPGHPTPGWWDQIVGPGRALDTDRWAVLCANVLGGCQGTTGPSSRAPDGRPWGSRWPRTTIRDQVAVELALLDHLGVQRATAVIGGSMGGMRALEWAVGAPHRVGAALVLAVGAAATTDQIATQSVQLRAILGDPGWAGGDYHLARPGDGPHAGLGLARRIAQLTYRTDTELEARFGRAAQPGEDPLGPSVAGSSAGSGRFAVQSYLDHQADTLIRRFDAGSYVALTDAMSTHDIGRGRGGVPAALRAVQLPLVVAGIDSDRLYPLRLQAEIAALVPTAEELRVIASPHGHDAFLLESVQVGKLVEETLARSVG
ncbi:MAG: homoserine O-acetyltransferase [Actinomycetota bacterium]|nr:MAG: homoserine O-acetyltransferase [Actinomycetota bacterium]